MQQSDWERLRAPFPPAAVAWRVVQVTPDRQSARVVPQLSPAAISARLDEVCGPAGWSVRFVLASGAVVCELSVAGAVRSAVAEPLAGESLNAASTAAWAGAAQLFGMAAPVSAEEEFLVDYDAEEGRFLPPELEPGEIDVPLESPPAEPADRPNALKPEAQQAIDRLVERLKSEGKGLETARLLVRFGGYGEDPESARELYRQLRGLLTAQIAGEA